MAVTGGPRRSATRLEHPGEAAQLSAGRSRERALVADTPALSSKFALFNHLTKGERPIGLEQLPASAWPRPRPAHLAVVLALAAIVTLCLTLSTQIHSMVRPCQATSAAGAGAYAPVRGLNCAYATTKQLSAVTDAVTPARAGASDRTEGGVTVEDLGHEATELVSLANGEAKSLSKLAELAVRQVPGLRGGARDDLAGRRARRGGRQPSRPGRAHRPGGQDRARGR